MQNSKQRRASKVREIEANRLRQQQINAYVKAGPAKATEEYQRESPCVIGTVKCSSRDLLQTMDGYGERAADVSGVTDDKMRRRVVNAGNAETVKRSTVSPKTPDEIAARRGRHKSIVGVNPHCGCVR